MGRGVSRRRREGHEEWGFRSRRDRVVEALLVDKMQLHDADAWRPRCSAHREHSRPEEYKVQGSEGATCSHSAHTAPACVGLSPIARRPVWHAHQPQSTQSTPINPNQPQSTQEQIRIIHVTMHHHRPQTMALHGERQGAARAPSSSIFHGWPAHETYDSEPTATLRDVGGDHPPPPPPPGVQAGAHARRRYRNCSRRPRPRRQHASPRVLGRRVGHPRRQVVSLLHVRQPHAHSQ